MPPDIKRPIHVSLLPIRSGDPVRTLPGSGDQLTGRVTAVYAGGTYYRVRFPVPSPYFYDEGAVFRAHEIELATQPVVADPKPLFPKRPQPFKSNQ